MTRRIGIILGISLMIIALTGSALADCHCAVYSNYLQLDRNGFATFSVPAFLYNVCNVGGIQLDIVTDPPGAVLPIDIDMTGSRLEQWEFLSDTTNDDSASRRFVGVANWPGGPQTPPLDSGQGLLFNIIFEFGCNYGENTSIFLTFENVIISDSTGYRIYDDVGIGGSFITIGDDVTPINRGDTNCSGSVTGPDVTYLVNFFRGVQDCPCSRCAGDSNGDGNVIGSDVTYLVRYFSGTGNAPRPCD
jgi:hypothetical protein